MRGAGWALLALYGCAEARIWPLETGSAALARFEHPKTVAVVVPLADRRRPEEADDRGGRYVYRGIEYRGTRLEQLGLEPLEALGLAVAKHLAAARVFARVVVVDDARRAPDADLVLSGALVRLRGYVEVEPPEGEKRRVVAEAELGPFELSDQKGPLFRGTVGWSFHDRRDGDPEPWSLAQEALRPALDQLAASLSRARLDGAARPSGSAPLPPIPLGETGTAALAGAGPPGWRFSGRDPAPPEGWGGAACLSGRIRAEQEHGFHRRLGPYVPELTLWWCPADASLRWDPKSEFSARFLGSDGAGRNWFGRQVGASAWKRAAEDFASRAGLRPPPGRHVFGVGPDGPVVPDRAWDRPGPAGAAPSRARPERLRDPSGAGPGR